MRRAGVVLAFLLAGSCLLDRRSTDFECEQTTDCADGRTCSFEGFCIDDDEENPGGLECNEGSMTCTASCGNDFDCGALMCPAGFSCTFDCDSPNSCASIDCSEAESCDIFCSAANACGGIVCGGECDVECNGNNACSSVTCSDACKCDVDCDGGTGCGTPSSCPTSEDTGDACTDGELGCDSGNVGCDTCP